MVNYTCLKCGKEFNRKCNFIDHTEKKKNPCKPKININELLLPQKPQINLDLQTNNKTEILNKEEKVKNNYSCSHCGFNFTRRYHLTRHLDGRCKVKKNDNKEKETIIQMLINKEKDNNEIIKQLQNKIDDLQKVTIPEYNTKLVNKQLIDIIINKDKKIEELENNKTDTNQNFVNDIENKNIENNDKKTENLVINAQTITYMYINNYINVTELCKAGGKKFSDWIFLDSTKELIEELEKNTNTEKSIIINNDGKPVSLFKKSNKKNTDKFYQDLWIHPDLAIQLAQWIGPKFALQICSWVRTLYSVSKVEIAKNKMIKQENIIKLSESKIKLLENIIVKKQKRIDYPETNVIYLLTTESNKKNRIYILGKSKNLTTRLATYNKTCEHEVVYYKSCETEEKMDIVEKIVLSKLSNYKERANRDRFILPNEHDIQLFTNIIDKTINFINN